jgi:hypothetical protein
MDRHMRRLGLVLASSTIAAITAGVVGWLATRVLVG